jgi:hypothetical protein
MEMTEEEIIKRRDEVREMLAAVEKQIKAIAEGGYKSYEIRSSTHQRSIDKVDLKDLLSLKKEYQAELKALEEALASDPEEDDSGEMLIRFER